MAADLVLFLMVTQSRDVDKMAEFRPKKKFNFRKNCERKERLFVRRNNIIVPDEEDIEQIDLHHLTFDADSMQKIYASFVKEAAAYEWSFDPFVMEHFRPTWRSEEMAATANSR
ncbi:MAG TPA: hypothetical protein EYQ20_03790 [candidate division Zixibacteria bacterium]|nr:hypothetical protein [candidate division Zixibacteria bacterium]